MLITLKVTIVCGYLCKSELLRYKIMLLPSSWLVPTIGYRSSIFVLVILIIFSVTLFYGFLLLVNLIPVYKN